MPRSSWKSYIFQLDLKKKMPQWAKKDRFLLFHFYTCLAHPKLQQCFITTQILKIKFVAQLLAKQKEKHKLYLC